MAMDDLPLNEDYDETTRLLSIAARKAGCRQLILDEIRSLVLHWADLVLTPIEAERILDALPRDRPDPIH